MALPRKLVLERSAAAPFLTAMTEADPELQRFLAQ
jgi:hypothetical protein